jgi:arsenite-transporting ATPase
MNYMERCGSVFFQYEYNTEKGELAQDFHIVKMPLLSEEVRGVESLKKFVDRSFIRVIEH